MRAPVAGLGAHVDLVVAAADTAVALGSGDVPVLATPRLLALAEAAAVAAVAAALPQGCTSVGIRVDLEHVRPSPVGTAVRVEATLAAVDGRLLHFAVVATHGDATVVARGHVTRVVVDRARFLQPGARPAQTPLVERG